MGKIQKVAVLRKKNVNDIELIHLVQDVSK
jgi:hypothetical protein